MLSFVLYFLSGFYFSNRYYPLRYNWSAQFRIFGAMLAVFLAVWFCRGESVWLNLLIKTAGVLGFGGLLLFWNDGEFVGFLRDLLRRKK